MMKRIRIRIGTKRNRAGRGMDREFTDRIREIVRSEEYRGLKDCRHHVRCNVYDHSVKVAYLCYRHHRRFGTNVKLDEFIRGALLHDYYLYDWHDKPGSRRFLHGFTHPGTALANALSRYPDLTRTERDMIRRHMFPLTPIPPKTKAGWLLCFYDKVAAVGDYLGRNSGKLRKASRKKRSSGQTFPNPNTNVRRRTRGSRLCRTEKNSPV